MRFIYCRPIRFGETDGAGVVYFSNLLSLCHEAYEAALADAGVNLDQFFGAGAIAVPIVHADIDFRSPLRCGDLACVQVAPTGLAEHKFAIAYQIHHQDVLIATAQTLHCAIDPVTRQTVALPADLQPWLRGSN
ncbi:MAG: thioesterase family protein [Cyanobacteria bacterium P01_H01_bin.119]